MKLSPSLLAATGLACVLALTSIASAQRPGGPGEGRRGDHAPPLEMLDTDGDGNITKAEVDAHRAEQFAKADSNGDGVVSAEEMTAFGEAMKADRKAKRQGDMFARMDANGDGVIGAEEFGPRADEMFSKVDADGDGVITPEEREAAMAQMRERREGRPRRGEGRPE